MIIPSYCRVRGTGGESRAKVGTRVGTWAGAEMETMAREG